MRKRTQACCYCGSTTGITLDHVPPKNLFAKPRPSDLITVPACRQCHSTTWSKDDEYFRLKVAMSTQVGDHPEAQRVVERALQGLTRPEAAGFRVQFASDVFETWIRTPAGLFAETALAYRVDMQRVHSTVARITRGLFFHETGRRLPHTHNVRVVSETTLGQARFDYVVQLERDILTPLAQTPRHVIGSGVFAYHYQLVSKSGVTLSAWALGFYERMWFVALTAPKKGDRSRATNNQLA